MNKIIEIDETCWVKQKHHRGVPKKGTQQWYIGTVLFKIPNLGTLVVYKEVRQLWNVLKIGKEQHFSN